MIMISSSLEGREAELSRVKQSLQKLEFQLGGNWDYDHGCFDRPLDEAHQVWLRLPFDVVRGTLDAETEGTGTVIRFRTPFVLRHMYREGNDPEAGWTTYGGLFNQFQRPEDADAPVAEQWVRSAGALLKQAEGTF